MTTWDLDCQFICFWIIKSQVWCLLGSFLLMTFNMALPVEQINSEVSSGFIVKSDLRSASTSLQPYTDAPWWRFFSTLLRVEDPPIIITSVAAVTLNKSNKHTHCCWHLHGTPWSTTPKVQFVIVLCFLSGGWWQLTSNQIFEEQSSSKNWYLLQIWF